MLRTLLLIYVVYMVIGLVIQRRLLYPTHLVPPPEVLADHWFAAHRIERLFIEHDQGRTEAWFMPVDAAGAPTVVFAHGNAELIDDWPFIFAHYRQMGASVLLVEYRGYGRSDGAPTQRHIVSDFAAAIDRLVDAGRIDADRLIYHGRSLGGGVACALVHERKPQAIILQSAFASTGAIAWRFGYPGLLMRDPYPNARTLAMFDGPVLILHGRNDRIVPAGHGRKLHAAAPHSTLIEFNHGHNDFPLDAPEFWQPIRELVDSL